MATYCYCLSSYINVEFIRDSFKKYEGTLLDYQSHRGVRALGLHEGVKELGNINQILSEIKTELKESKD